MEDSLIEEEIEALLAIYDEKLLVERRGTASGACLRMTLDAAERTGDAKGFLVIEVVFDLTESVGFALTLPSIIFIRLIKAFSAR